MIKRAIKRGVTILLQPFMIDYSNIFDKEALTYTSYRTLVKELLLNRQTTGEDHSEEMLAYTKMNVQRMNRVDKTTVLSDSILATLAQLKGSYRILVITEGWCGDASQIVPVINQLVLAAPEKLNLRLVLRDKNLPLTDLHLTNGGRAIPILLVLDEAGTLLLPKWGPRPAVLQDLMAQWKSEGLEMPEMAEKLHGWYAKDKTKAIQEELNSLFKQLK